MPAFKAMKIDVLGAGAWGTALAIAAARHPDGHRVRLLVRDPAQAMTMRSERCNLRYLPQTSFPDRLEVDLLGADARPTSAADDADLRVVATPMAGLRGVLRALAPTRSPVIWLCKGFEQPLGPPDAVAHGRLGHEIAAEVAPELPAGVLSGPSFAQEVARGLPAALVAASPDPRVRQAALAAFHGPQLRIYGSEDIVGVEVGGAVKNVLAIATGVADGLALGGNARAALITRGLAEMTRLGVALGARAETFRGLSGLGDLVLTATGDLSRNRRVGLLLAQGQTLEQAVASLGHVAEGVYTARTAVQRARALGVEMPISEGVVALIEGRATPQAVLATLMSRDPKEEA